MLHRTTAIQPEADERRSQKIRDLLEVMRDGHGLKRKHARKELVAIGRAVTEPLIEALMSDSPKLRWEAAKALEQLSDPASAQALTLALEDPESDVRWVAAKALAAMPNAAVNPLLKALKQNAECETLRTGAHYVLRNWVERGAPPPIQEVLDALDDHEPVLSVPFAAYHALATLEHYQLN